MSTGRMMIGKVQVPLTEPCHFPGAELSRFHPELSVDVLSALNVEHGETLFDLRLRGRYLPDNVAYLTAAEGWVRSAGVIFSAPLLAVVRILQPRSPLTSIFDELGVSLRFPMRIVGGVLEVVGVASEFDFGELMAQVQGLSLSARIESIHDYTPRRVLESLDPRQLHVLRAALRAGYWDEPRRTSVEDLSRRLEISTSALTESLTQIERRLLHGMLRPKDSEDASPSPLPVPQ